MRTTLLTAALLPLAVLGSPWTESAYNDHRLTDGRMVPSASYRWTGEPIPITFDFKEPRRVGGVRILSGRGWVNCCVKRASFYGTGGQVLAEHVEFRPANTFKEIWTSWKPVELAGVKMVIEDTWDHKRNYYDNYTCPAQSMLPIMFDAPLWDVFSDDIRCDAAWEGRHHRGATVQIAEASFFGDSLPDDLPDRPNAASVAFPDSRLVRDWMYQDAAAKNVSLVANTTTDTRVPDRLGRDISQVKTNGDWRAKHSESRKAFLSRFREKFTQFVYVKHRVMGNSIMFSTDDLTDVTWEEWRHIPDYRGISQLCLGTINADGTVSHDVLLDRPTGVIRDPAVSPDATMIVFSMRNDQEKDNYHLYSLDLATRQLKQLTFDGSYQGRPMPVSDTEPTFAADGSIVFQSTRCGHITDCWPIPVSNVFRCDRDGRHIRRLGFDEVGTFFPQALEDGRILYSRWEYNDRTSGYAMSLFTMNPNGTHQIGYALNNTPVPTTMIHARGIPGADKAMFIDGGHHCGQKGKLVEVDPARTDDLRDWTYNPDEAFHGPYATTPQTAFRHRWNGSNDVQIASWQPGRYPAATREFMPGLDNIAGSANDGTPGRAPYRMPKFFQFPAWETGYSQIGPQWAYPHPLGEGRFLVSFMPEGARFQRGPFSSRMGVYAMDESGRRELLAFDWANHCMNAVPVVPRRMKRHAGPDVDWKNPWSVCYVHDVYSGEAARGIPRGAVKKLRVVAIGYRSTHIGWNGQYFQVMVTTNGKIGTPVSVGNGTYDVKHVLGEVDVEADGSCSFYVPARTPVYFQLIDAQGRMIQTMRSWMTSMPGEANSCLGCHERRTEALPASAKTPIAQTKGPQRLRPAVAGLAHPLLKELEAEGGALASVENFMNVNRAEDIGGSIPDRGFSFTRQIQPILDRSCVRCHGADEAKIPVATDDRRTVLDFRNRPGKLPSSDDNSHRRYSCSYLALSCRGECNDRVSFSHGLDNVPFAPPYTYGAVKSWYWDMLAKGHPRADGTKRVSLTADELKLFAMWIDLGVPFAGSYTELHDWSDWHRQRYTYFQNKRVYFAWEELNDIRGELGLPPVPLTGFIPNIDVPRKQKRWDE